MLEVVWEVGPLLSDVVLVGEPVIKGSMDTLLADVEHVLGVTTASFLEAPCGGVVEDQTTGARAVVVLLEIVPVVNSGVGALFRLDRVKSHIMRSDVSGPLVVLDGVLADFLFRGDFFSSADGNIEDDVCWVVNDLQALLDSGIDVDVPDGAAVHQDEAFEVLWREHNWDRSGGESSLGDITVINVVLGEYHVLS